MVIPAAIEFRKQLGGGGGGTEGTEQVLFGRIKELARYARETIPAGSRLKVATPARRAFVGGLGGL